MPQVIVSFLSRLMTFSMLLCLSRWNTIHFYCILLQPIFQVYHLFIFVTHAESTVVVNAINLSGVLFNTWSSVGVLKRRTPFISLS